MIGRVKPVLRTLYVCICFIGCLVFRLPQAMWVHAASEQGVGRMEYSQSPIDRVSAQEKDDKRATDDHFTSTDNRINEISDQVSFIKGWGSAFFAVLGALQTFGMIKENKRQR